MNDVTYDNNQGMWLDRSKPKTFYALDWCGLGEPAGEIETAARVIWNQDQRITRIEFDNVPEGVRIINDPDEAEQHHRASATLIERERIIEIIERCPRLDNDRTIDAPTLIALIRGLAE